jgi:hypothetical protein
MDTIEIKLTWDVLYNVICRIGQDPVEALLLSIDTVDVNITQVSTIETDGHLEMNQF